MAELNDKLITYGNLSTFYDKLQEQGLGGNAIEDASVLPDASENKDKLFRLESDDNVYVSELKSRTSITTNRLPDAQQIDKAYLYESGEEPYYYKGAWKLILNDGELEGYGWFEDYGENRWYLALTKDNAVNTASDTLVFVLDSEEGILDLENHTVTYNFGVIDYNWDNAYTLISINIYPIPAIYNAPESAQIGNATAVVDGNTYWYTGETGSTVVDGETITGYKWQYEDDADDYAISSKPASEVYYHIGEGEYEGIYYTDTKMYYDNTDFSTSTTYSIPQLNASEANQIENAYYEINGETYVYKGEIIGHFLNNTTLTLYQWYNPTMIEYTTTPATNIYGKVYASTEDSLGLYYDSESDMYVSTDYTAEDALSSRFSKIDGFNTVKYQRTVVTEVWDWQPLTDNNATNDDIDLMFDSGPVVKRVLMSDYASPLSIKEGLVNVSGETMEYDGQTYYKWVKYEEHDGESVIDDFGNDTELVVLTTSLNPSLPFSEESSEYAYHLVIDGTEGQYWGLDTYPEEALIHEDGSITYEE